MKTVEEVVAVFQDNLAKHEGCGDDGRLSPALANGIKKDVANGSKLKEWNKKKVEAFLWKPLADENLEFYRRWPNTDKALAKYFG